MKISLLNLYTRRKTRGGFSLVEIVIALAVVALAFLSIIALMGTGLSSDKNTTSQTLATNIAAAIISDLRSTQYVAAPQSSRFNIVLPTTAAAVPLPSTAASPCPLYFDNSSNPTATAANRIYSANVYVAEIQSTPVPVYMARVTVSWPAQSATPVGSTEVVTQFQLH